MSSVCVVRCLNRALFGVSLLLVSGSWSVKMHNDAVG